MILAIVPMVLFFIGCGASADRDESVDFDTVNSVQETLNGIVGDADTGDLSVDINALNAEQEDLDAEDLDAVLVEDNSDINKRVILQEVNTTSTSEDGFKQ